MAYVAAGAALVAAAMGAYGSYQQGQAQKQQAKYQSEVALRNADIAEMNAADRERQGQIEEKQLRLRTANTIGQARSDLSSSGVALETGSPLDILSDTAAWGEYDVQMNRWNTSKDAWAIRNQAADYSSQSALYTPTGNNAASAGAWNAGTSLIGGLGTAADRWYSYKASESKKTTG